MPAINFSVFADKVESGEKLTTIRKRHFKKGGTAYLYTGMRTKQCRKLGEGIIVSSIPISIILDDKNGAVYFTLDGILYDKWRRLHGDMQLTKDDYDKWHDEYMSIITGDGFEQDWQFFDFFRNKYGNTFDGFLTTWVKIP